MVFTGEFYQAIKKELSLILLNLFQKTEEGGTLPNAFYEALISLIPKPDKDSTDRQKLQINLSHEFTCINPQQNISTLIQPFIKRI